MTDIVLRSGDAELHICPERGFTAHSWLVDGFDHLYREDGFPETGRTTHSGVPVLFPWPNRIAGSHFTWAGADYSVPPTDGLNSLHGFACRSHWQVADLAPDRVTGSFRISRDAPGDADSWPADAQLDLTFELRPRQVTLSATVANPSDRPLPFGLGYHPYFRVPGDSSSWRLHCAAAEEWVLDACIPTGVIRPVGDRLDFRTPRPMAGVELDDAVTGLPPAAGLAERAALSGDGRTVTIDSDPAFGDYVLFTPQSRGAVAIEPYTCATDAIHLEQRGIPAGWRTLAPGGTETFVVRFGVRTD